MVTLRAGSARARVVPDMGAGLAELSVFQRPVLRSWDGSDKPFALALNLLVPFSNRISSGGFAYNGTFLAIAPNLAGEACPIHGDGFQRPWTPVYVTESVARLDLTDGQIGPFSYCAAVTYALAPQQLSIALNITNTGLELPFGAGFHPWFPRGACTQLTFSATGQWPEDDRYLPLRCEPEPLPSGGPYATGTSLPDGFVNMAYDGWMGEATITQGPDAVSVSVTAPGLMVAQVYSPGADAGFFCFEPVSHPVDAHNAPGFPGLRILPQGGTLTLEMTLGWTAAPPSQKERET